MEKNQIENQEEETSLKEENVEKDNNLGKIEEDFQENSENCPLTLELINECGVTIGHANQYDHPSMKRFIEKIENNTSIINAQKTLDALNNAMSFMEKAGNKGTKVLLIGTKGIFKHVVDEYAQKIGAYFVSNKWKPGNLTNFSTLNSNISKRNNIEKILQDLEVKNVTDTTKVKKFKTRELEKFKKFSIKFDSTRGGLRKMKELPGVLIVTDIGKDIIAIEEAKKLKIPVIGISDTNRNCSILDYIIPGNDDAIRSVRLIVGKLSNAYLEGLKKKFSDKKTQEKEDSQPQPAVA